MSPENDLGCEKPKKRVRGEKGRQLTKAEDFTDEWTSTASEGSTDSKNEDGRSRTCPALEGGWGWAVVLSGFILHVLTRGCLFSTGILFSEWTSFFGKSKRDTALVGSICTGCALMLGPIGSRSIERWGYRVTAMAGGAIATVGFLTSYLANEVYYLYLTYGLLTGTGLGISYLCGVVAVGEYFDERRSIAFGIAAAGAGCGASVMAVLQRAFLEEYGWRGTMIILAGLSGLNQMAFGALLRPLSSSLNWNSKAGKRRLLQLQLDGSLGGDESLPTELSGSSKKDFSHSESGSSICLNGPDVRISICSEDADAAGYADGQVEKKQLARETILQPRERTSSDVCPRMKNEALSPSLLLRRKIVQAYGSNPSSPLPLPRHKKAQSQYYLSDSEEKICESTRSIAVVEDDHRRRTVRRLKRAPLKINTGDAMYLSSISIASSRAVVDKMLSSKDLRRSRAFDQDESTDESTSKSSFEGSEEHSLIVDGTTYERPYPAVLKNPLFLVLVVNQFFTSLGIMIPFVHLTQKAILMGINENQAAYLVAVIGIGNVVGKIVIGLLCDMKWTDIFIVFVTTQFGLAFSVMMFPLFTSYATIAFASFLFGFFYGNYSAIPSLTAEYVGLRNLAHGIGYINFLEGVAGIVGPPLAGAIYDVSLSYNVAFAVAAGFLLISSLVLGLQPYFYKKVKGKRSSLERLFRGSKAEDGTQRLDSYSTRENQLGTPKAQFRDHNGNCINLNKEALNFSEDVIRA